MNFIETISKKYPHVRALSGDPTKYACISWIDCEPIDEQELTAAVEECARQSAKDDVDDRAALNRKALMRGFDPESILVELAMGRNRNALAQAAKEVAEKLEKVSTQRAALMDSIESAPLDQLSRFTSLWVEVK